MWNIKPFPKPEIQPKPLPLQLKLLRWRILGSQNMVLVNNTFNLFKRIRIHISVDIVGREGK